MSVGSDLLAETAALADQTDATLPPRSAADTEPGSWESVGATRGEPPEVSPAHYQMLGEQGRGGLGRVLRARDLRTGRLVAIKEILRGSDAAVRRFRREALVTANLQHPAIVPVYEVGRWPDGQPFYAMKLVDGVTLASAIHDATAVSDRLALVPHVIQVADALAYAHAQGWIHRDLKPGNVLVGAFGETVVIDWGLAKRIASSDSETTLDPARDPGTTPGDDAATLDGQVLGTPVYMPPEQARGDAVDARADVYAIGALLYHVLAGVPPYHGAGTAANVLARVTAGPPRPLVELAPTVPVELGTIVARAMAHRAEDRYPSARELADDLARFRAGSLVAAHRYTRWQLVRRWLRRHRTAVAVAALAIAALIAGGTISFRENLIARRRAEAEGRRATAAQATAEDRRRDAEARVVALHTELGLRELTAGSPARALPYLADAFRKAPDDPIVGFLIGRALEASQRLELAVRTGSVVALSFGGARVLPLSPVAAPVIELDRRRALAPIPGLLGVLAPDGTWLVARDDADVVQAIDAATGTVRARRPGSARPSVTRWVGIDRGGRVITLDDHGVVQVSASDLVPTATAQVPFAPKHALIVDARHVIGAGPDGALWRWDATTATAIRPTSPHRAAVTVLCGSADAGIWISMDPSVTAVWRGEALVAQAATAGLPGSCAIDRAG